MSDFDEEMDIDGGANIEVSEVEIFSDPLFYHAPVDAFQLMQYEKSLTQSPRPSKGWMSRLFSSAQESAAAPVLPIDQMLRYQSDPLPVPLLKSSTSFHAQSLEMFQHILQLTSEEQLVSNQLLQTLQKLLQWGLESTEMRDELYMQIFKQTRGDMNDGTRRKTWKAFHVIALTMPPSNVYSNLLTHYVQRVCREDQEIESIKEISNLIWNALKKSVRSGPRKTVPSLEEISVHFCERQQRMKTTVSFLDGTSEDLPYDVGTTVMEAVHTLASIIGLVHCQGFSLFEGVEDGDSGKGVEHLQLYDHAYIPDILHRFAKGAGEGKTYRLVFKKVLFRESDAYVLESQFLNLSFLQAQYDFLVGHYPVGHEDAAKLCALQLFSDFGTQLPQSPSGLKKAIDGYTSPDVTGPKEDWKKKVLEYYHGLMCASKEDARNCFLSLLRNLPYGMAIFFSVHTLKDPIGLLPARVILGINKSGLHFLRWLPKEYLSSVDFRDIAHFGFCSQSITFNMKISGAMHVFSFKTTNGQDICMALKTHITDAASRSNGAAECQDGSGTLMDTSFGKEYDAHLAKMHEAIGELETKQQTIVQTQNECTSKIGHSKAQLEQTLLCIEEAMTTRDAIRKDVSALQSEILNLQSDLEVMQKGQSSAKVAHQIELLQEERDLLQRIEWVSKNRAEIESKYAEMEETRRQEKEALQTAIHDATSSGWEDRTVKDRQMATLIEQIANKHAMMHANAQEVEKIQKDKEELAELKKLQSEIEEKERIYAMQIETQRQKIHALEELRKSDQISRKKLFNTIQDLKGKIRVYARVRPVLNMEQRKGQQFALQFPDAFSISHLWKRDASPREYTFDGVFSPDASQNDVFQQTEDLIQSTLDGYNVCIFAYGQTGSGKTYTIYGSDSQPGLAPRGIRKLFELLNKNAHHTSYRVSCYMLELYRDTLMDLLVEKKSDGLEERRYSELPIPLSSPSFPRRTSLPRLSDCPPILENKRLSELPRHKERLEIKTEKGIHSMVHVQGVTTVEVDSAEDLIATFERGQRRRHVAATQMNIQSSRSHLIMSIVVEATDLQSLTQTKGKLTFVDLAGSERLKKSGSAGQQLKEAQAINKSLSALGDVISALARGDGHIPYRNHKLTMLMSDSIGGNAKTLMFVNVSPTDDNLAETQNSLQYATRVRTIKNEMSRETNKEMALLKRQLSAWRSMTADQKNALTQEYM